MVRPLSSINMALNRAASAGAAGAVDPESLGTLTAWYDISDASNRTVASGILTDLNNKAAIDTTNDALMDDGATDNAGLHFNVGTQINDLAGARSEKTTERALVVRDLTQTFTRPGTGAVRYFFTMRAVPGDTTRGYVFQTGARDASGGGMNLIMNNGTAGDFTVQVYDASTSGNAQTNVTVSASNNSLNDGATHVVMVGREIGTGAAGVDRVVCSIDGVVPFGFPVDLPSGLGALNNTGATNAAAGWTMIGATAAAPTHLQLQSVVTFGEFLMYKTDMDAGEEAAVVSYLTDKWVGAFSTAGLTWWIDPNQSDAVTLSGTEIQTIDDKVQGTSSSQLIIRDTQPGAEQTTDGGVNWMDFDGAVSDRAMEVSSATEGALNAASGDFTVFVVVQPQFTGAGSDENVFAKGFTGWYRLQSRGSIGSLSLSGFADENGGATFRVADTAADVMTQNANHILRFTIDRTNGDLLRVHVDGTEQATADISTLGAVTDTGQKFVVGCRASGAAETSFWDGLIGEMLVFKQTVNGTQATDVEAYLSDKWSTS